MGATTCNAACPSTDTNDCYDYIREWRKPENIASSMRFAAKLNVPLFPRKEQFVIGTTKHLLPYFVFSEHFHIVSLAENEWSLAKNCKLIRCIANTKPALVRVVTQPEKMYKNGSMTVTAKELCILMHEFKYKLYKYEPAFNIYFLFRSDITDPTATLDTATIAGVH